VVGCQWDSSCSLRKGCFELQVWVFMYDKRLVAIDKGPKAEPGILCSRCLETNMDKDHGFPLGKSDSLCK
jgi:hypothetical protein